MQIIITDMNFKMLENKIIEKLKKENEILKDSKIEIIKIYESKRYNRIIFNAKLEIDNESCPKVISGLKLNMGWDRCRVFDGTDVLQCFKYQGYNHKSSECRNGDTCYKCRGNHRSKECNKEIIFLHFFFSFLFSLSFTFAISFLFLQHFFTLFFGVIKNIKSFYIHN